MKISSPEIDLLQNFVYNIYNSLFSRKTLRMNGLFIKENNTIMRKTIIVFNVKSITAQQAAEKKSQYRHDNR